ncbi:FemAB family PEP-CTERM system-associated protein [Methylicorpusculum oleiharenae]|uniref:FemAB family XrtA/PEP-CTERM system-associated protein n=1 Tax=Methylicorpusculum oleiharenae TaxID=1338687 RepID=UPI001359FB55|nr:FemAB family XrtA/PEP-CTERM system-associated protein [Methylicorpusculum oleiharenae]MCD2451844.1 FemAB family PEP-CTERM system-associated protein [Methylicorpusculum oleiharenae]
MIKILDVSDYQKWDDFVNNHHDATFFHLSGWKEVIERSFGHKTYFLYVEKNGAISAILPLAHIKSALFGNALTSLSFCVYGGIVGLDQNSMQLLDKRACELAEELGVDYLELRNRTRQTPDRPFKDLYVTFRKTLETDVDKNMQAIPRKQRAMIRKGIAAGLQSKIDTNVERFYQAYSESVRNLGTPVFSKKFFQILKEIFQDQCEILTVEKDGQLISSVMSFYFKDEVLPYYGGGTDLARAVQGNDFMYWEVMRRAVENGIKVFDYGRSKIGTGSYSFKKHWGFEPEPLFYEFHLVKAEALPDINPLNPKYQLFIAAWKKLPLAMSQLVGPWLSKDLG